MPEPLEPVLAELRALLSDPRGLVRAIASGRRHNAEVKWRRVELRPVQLKAGLRLQIVEYDERQAHTRNAGYEQHAGPAVDDLLAMGFGNWHVKSVGGEIQVRITRKGEAQVHRVAERQADQSLSHNRSKPRLLDADDPFWQAVGISGADGKVKPSRQDKYRQVEEFIRELDTVLKPELLPVGRALRVVDLGCGNAHLSFAAYRYLTRTRGLDVTLVGVDVKRQARERNNALAAELGWDGIRFVEGTIADAPVDGADVVLALHACDTATDDALARAVRWQAPIVLAAPCCHHDIQTQLRSHPAPGAYGMVTRHGILRERLADILTDAFRAALMRMAGYRVEVVEFVPSEHTPRNTMLRAIRTGSPPDAAVTAQYAELVETWAVKPRLAELI
ncbi:MAG: methyltransferase [Rhodospirillales bacterium]|nr:methyltransferase [Rhodospirillales bacterium]